MNNNKYISVGVIMAKLARDYKSLDIQIADIVEWCAEAEKNIGEFLYFERFERVPIKIKNRKAELPCNLWRLLSVSGQGCSVSNYVNTGSSLNFSDNSFSNALSTGISPPKEGDVTLLISYIGVPIDEEGFPMIMEGHEEACYWYILTKVLFEDYLNNKISSDRWEYINYMYGKYVSKAKSSMQFVSRDDIDRMSMIRYNMVQSIKMPKRNFT